MGLGRPYETRHTYETFGTTQPARVRRGCTVARWGCPSSIVALSMPVRKSKPHSQPLRTLRSYGLCFSGGKKPHNGLEFPSKRRTVVSGIKVSGNWRRVYKEAYLGVSANACTAHMCTPTRPEIWRARQKACVPVTGSEGAGTLIGLVGATSSTIRSRCQHHPCPVSLARACPHWIPKTQIAIDRRWCQLCFPLCSPPSSLTRQAPPPGVYCPS